MDVKVTFLNGRLEEEVYMKQPEGFFSSNSEHLVYKLNKFIYGLKQASRQWYLNFHEVITSFDFEENIMDQCIYQKVSRSKICFLVLYVDDILLATDDKNFLYEVKKFLSKNFDMKDMGYASYVIGIEIHRERFAPDLTFHMLLVFWEDIRVIQVKFLSEGSNKARTGLELDNEVGSLNNGALGVEPMVEKKEVGDSLWREITNLNCQKLFILWDGVQKPITSCLQQTLHYIQNWRNLHQKSLSPCVTAPILQPRWTPPPRDFVKCNTDAVIFQEQGKFGVAACIRDSNGSFIYAMSLCYNGMPSPSEAEARSLELTLIWLSSHEFNNIILEFDSKQIIDSTKGKRFQNNEVGDILRSCVAKISSFQNYVVHCKPTNQSNCSLIS
ncbi:Retrovirus-related Pol polyprotein from transposon TNT 1-94 [Glycine soja]|uniref:Retrovirus-related Pol polyprotein from transposon TNT 1-94 n=2 Tax=Glycine soja TaxID=3848 RepID=A0A445IYR1_GLYSO|nr:Retrovirus-related Pol polyprotein from transposon TNT 1-94 [Glycine soja]